MITAGKTYKAAVVKSDLYTYLMCIPASGYFILVAGGYSSERMKAFFIVVLSFAAIMLVADTLTIMGWIRNLIKNYENPAYNRDVLKADILNMPYRLARKSMIKWLMSIIFVPLAIYITVGYSLLNFLPLLIIIPVMASLTLISCILTPRTAWKNFSRNPVSVMRNRLGCHIKNSPL